LIDAKTAERIGLVEQLAAGADLDALLETITNDIRAGAPGAIRAQKRLMQRWEQLPLAEAIEAGVGAFVASYASSEPADYVARFFSSRVKPE
jgi:enoyl-CoA hydratase/carnithine racemase